MHNACVYPYVHTSSVSSAHENTKLLAYTDVDSMYTAHSVTHTFTTCTCSMFMYVYMYMYGSFLEKGDPNIDPKMLSSLL